jgi:glutamate-1-semialdehyde 2,1-aminomutase/spore coat polysaccharide biosynthesis protein SpsF
MPKSPSRARPLNLTNSETRWADTLKLIPAGTQTFSKAPFQHVSGVSPKYLVRGKGSRVWDLDGNEYVDYMLGLGPAILGHANEEVNEAAWRAMQDGIAMSLPHPLETELARLLTDIIPCAEMVRFGKNGSDVTTGAVRLARAVTGRDMVACCGYHGWQDWYIGSTWRNSGVPRCVQELTRKFVYNDIGSLKRLFAEYPDRIACVIMEPATFHEPQDNFLEKVRDLVHENRSILIFDEIITGFRMDLGGAQKRFGVTPNLACFGKAMGNGFPISAVVGKAELMRHFEEVFFSFTMGGETASLAAALTTIKILRDRNGIKRIHAMGDRLASGMTEAVVAHGMGEAVSIIGFPYWPEYVFKAESPERSREIQSLFQQELVRRGVLTRAGMFLSTAHDDSDLDLTLNAFGEALAVVKEALEQDVILDWLEGDIIQPVIRPPKE